VVLAVTLRRQKDSGPVGAGGIPFVVVVGGGGEREVLVFGVEGVGGVGPSDDMLLKNSSTSA
jgi:hypothetical protein